jgi:hypothetical protein
MKGWGGRPFSSEGVGGYPFFQPGLKKIRTFLGNFGHFVAQKVPKIAQTAFWGRFKVFKATLSNFSRFRQFFADFG